ncbi:T-cell immunomodulatory like protein [Dictyocoela muelleri]|nr:T-cell immunomodulatory like protein [Dictyocoela muelleri]
MNKNKGMDAFSPLEDPPFIFSSYPVNDFILMNYGPREPGKIADLVGVNNSRKKLQVYRYEEGKFNLMKDIEYTSDKYIHMIIPADFRYEGKSSYLIVERSENNSYELIYVFPDQSIVKYKEKSQIIPIILTYDDRLKIKTLIQKRDKGLVFLEINPDNSILLEEIPFKYKLIDCHSSALVDYKGNLDVQLLMIANDENQNFLVNLSGEKILKLPENIGPVIFNDFNNDGELEIAYISKDYTNYFLNIQKMTGSQEKVRLDLKNEFGNEYEPVIRNNRLGNLHGGIFAADLEKKGKIDIILTMLNNQNNTNVIRMISVYTKNGEIKFVKSIFSPEIESIQNVISVSSFDYDNSGKENLFINFREGANHKMAYFKNNMNPHFLKLTIMGVDQKNLMPIPGVSFRIKTLSENMIRNCVQSPQSSFLHLQKPYIFLGLGSMNVFIDKIDVSILRKKITMGATDKIIPNSNLIMKIGDKVEIELYLNITESIKHVIYITLLVLMLNLVFVFGLFFRDRKKERLLRKKELQSFNFEAL